MDIRITNTCNNNCLYCLEQTLRDKRAFMDLSSITKKITIEKWKTDTVISIYWGNPFLHPEIENIIRFCKEQWFSSINILTNGYWIEEDTLDVLQQIGLSGIWFYFNSLSEKNHEIITWNPDKKITVKQLLKTIYLSKRKWLYVKVIIHLHTLNIQESWKIIKVLSHTFQIQDFEFINFFPFDRPYNEYKKTLFYDFEKKRKYIDSLMKVLILLKLRVKFVKFPQIFFWEYTNYYDIKTWILEQIWPEDLARLDTKDPPFCFLENRCQWCFIQDNCSFYERRK